MNKEADLYPVTLADIDRQLSETGDRQQMAETAAAVTVESGKGAISLIRNRATSTIVIQHT